MQKLGGTCAFVDAEHALDVQYASKLGVNLADLLISQPDTGEQALEITDALVRSGSVDLIVVDSVAALVPKAEIEGEMGDSLPGLQARLMSQALQADRHHQEDQLHGHLHQPDPHEDRCDVRQPRNHHRRQRAQVLRLGAPGHPPHRLHQEGRRGRRQRNPRQGRQNKVAPPFKQAEFDIMYGAGISREGEIIDLGVAANVVDKSGAWYSYNGNRIGQGKDNVREYLKEHRELAIEIENRVRENQGVVRRSSDARRAAEPAAAPDEWQRSEQRVRAGARRTRRIEGARDDVRDDDGTDSDRTGRDRKEGVRDDDGTDSDRTGREEGGRCAQADGVQPERKGRR